VIEEKAGKKKDNENKKDNRGVGNLE